MMDGLGKITVFNNQAVPAKTYMENLMYGEHTLDNTAKLLGLSGGYVQPANRFGLVEPVEFDSRGHQSDQNPGFYPGGKTPWHITSSNESYWSPDSGEWKIKNIEWQYQYTPSLEQLQQKQIPGEAEYIDRLKKYFNKEEASDGHSLVMPAPFKKQQLK